MVKKIILIIFVACLLFLLWLAWGFFSGNNFAETSFTISPGQGVNEISNSLYQAGLIKNKFIFETWVWLEKSEDKMQAGFYQIPENVSVRELINIFVRGPQNTQTSITIVEGWSRQWPQFQKAIENVGLDYAKFIKLSDRKTDWDKSYSFLADAPASASLEGYLFPNTHFVDQSTTEEDLLNKLLSDFDKKLSPDLREEIKKQNKTIFEVVTLASIIEREVPEHEDRKMIADIFLKRLENNIGLQSDATVNFITGKGMVQPTYEDTRIDSPYNTYKYRGLPPGPISNPGLASIEAVIYPVPNPFYYFLTTPEGQVIYSKTYDEHLANKNKYLK